MTETRRFLRWLALLLWLLAGVASAASRDDVIAAVPNPRASSLGWVADPAGAIRARRAELDALIGQFERETGIEIAVVVLPSIGALDTRDFATGLFKAWGIGKRGRDNGILVLHALDQRRVEIEVGYGLEGSLPDVKCGWIIDDIAAPFFRQGSFADGHYEMVRAIIAALRDPAAGRARLAGGVTLVPGTHVDPPPAAWQLPRLSDVEVPARTSSTGLALAPLALGLSVFVTHALVIRRYRLRHPDLHEQWTHWRQWSWLVYAGMELVVAAGAALELLQRASVWSALLLAPGALLSRRYVRARLRRLRELPRQDPKTGEPMRRLDEQADDAYLKAGQIVEERIRSKDYDVWVSPSGYFRIDQYDGSAPAGACPVCHFATYRLVGTRVLVPADTTHDGRAEDSFQCAACDHTQAVTRTLARLSSDPDTAGGSSSGASGGGAGGSFGGGSFGGGSSGGGGAGRSY